MKFIKILPILLFCSLLALQSCKDKASDSKIEATDSMEVSNTPAQPNPTAEPAQNADGVWHYTCSKGCTGGAGVAGSICATCGGPLDHNQAYHAAASANPSNPIMLPPTNATPPPTPEPAQNAAGVWHYTCAKGCAGGAGTASNCSTCGGPLAHNQAYHN